MFLGRFCGGRVWGWEGGGWMGELGWGMGVD